MIGCQFFFRVSENDKKEQIVFRYKKSAGQIQKTEIYLQEYYCKYIFLLLYLFRTPISQR
ncbi:hypothetical protein BHF70_04620 [Anaerostipes sp. 494a]|nr:hypothetical protein BHF70_04620 [Anaerostipes sp. 494a]